MRSLGLVFVLLAACASDGAAPPPDAVAPASVATGELGPWQAAAPLPVARANHCSAVVGDTLLVLGGNTKVGDAFVKTAAIHAGTVVDGTITWTLAGSLPSPATECTATADGRRLYVLDGLYERETDGRQVFAAELDDTGRLGALAHVATLPQIAISSEAAVRGGALLLMDTLLPAEGDDTVTLRTPTTTEAWTTDAWGIGFRAQAQYAFTARFAYALGGYLGAEGNPVTADAFVAPIGDDGRLGTARPTTPLPAPLAFGEAVAVDDYLFVAGGRGQVFGAAGSTAVYAAPIAGDGSLGAWRAVAELPAGRTNHELAVVGDYLVVTGGATMGPGEDAVYVAQVRFRAE